MSADRAPTPRWARGPIAAAMLLTAAALTVGSFGYGYERDELYFRMLRPAWGYVDQPPLTPLIVHGVSLLADELWAIRIPATIAAVLTVFVIAGLTRELGGGRAAQTFAAFGLSLAIFPILFGHVAITASIEMAVWPAIAWAIVRAQLRERPHCWLIAGGLVGIDLLNKVLIVVLLVALLLGLLVAGPRRLLASPWVWGAVLIAVVIGSPTIAYQILNDFPQLEVGRALAADNGGDVRAQMWWFLTIILGPPLTVVWIVGFVALLRRPQWRAVRFLAAALPFLLLGVFAMGSQVYYPFGLAAVMYAAGCDPVVQWWTRGRGRRATSIVLVAINAIVAVTLGFPVVPVSAVGATPIPGVNQLVADAVGWPAYVRQVAAVYGALPANDRAGAVILASNYGEAGAVDRFGRAEGIEVPVVSGQNALWDQAKPADSVSVAVVVGGEYDQARSWFASCVQAGRLDNGVDVDNEEQDQPIGVCRDPIGGWDVVWPKARHLD